MLDFLADNKLKNHNFNGLYLLYQIRRYWSMPKTTQTRPTIVQATSYYPPHLGAHVEAQEMYVYEEVLEGSNK
jgi:hypothetical protein